MQFKIRITGLTPDIGAIERAITTVDPSVLIDIDQTGQTLRVAASIEATHLRELLDQAGYPVAQDQLEQVPSECCGGCGG